MHFPYQFLDFAFSSPKVVRLLGESILITGQVSLCFIYWSGQPFEINSVLIPPRTFLIFHLKKCLKSANKLAHTVVCLLSSSCGSLRRLETLILDVSFIQMWVSKAYVQYGYKWCPHAVLLMMREIVHTAAFQKDYGVTSSLLIS